MAEIYRKSSMPGAEYEVKDTGQGALYIACVKWGKTYHACYANRLYDMVKRHLPRGIAFTFLCFTEDAAGLVPGITARALPEDLSGWWNKLYLFKNRVFEEQDRVIYFDLDTLITGPLDEIAGYRGDFALLRDFYRTDGYGSGVMCWRAGACDTIWERFEAAGRPEIPGGDQAWIEKVIPGAALLQELFPGMFVSFKVDCRPLPPPGACVVSFHGEPKQDNCGAPWVRDIWKIGGAGKVDEKALGREAERARRMRFAATLVHPWLVPAEAHDKRAMIIGGGASLEQSLDEIRGSEKQMTLFAAGSAAQVLERHHVPMDVHVLMEEGTVAATPPQRYYASTCVPELFAQPDGNITLWNPDEASLTASTTGLCALRIAFALGYRTLHLVGFDGCYESEERRSEEERISDITIDGRTFAVTPWMISQVREFALLADAMVREGAVITVHGDGLIPFLSRKLAQP